MEKQYCEICFEMNEFKRVKLEEVVTVRDLTYNVLHEYDQCTNCNELFEPYEDVDKNIKNDYMIYRNKVGYLQPQEIKGLREKYGMSVRQFAAVLGIGYSTISNIENGALQNEYQNTLFEFASSPSAMYKIVLKKNNYLDCGLDSVLGEIEGVCIREEPHMEELKNKLQQTIARLDENDTFITRKLNTLEYDVEQLMNKGNKIEGSKSKWTKSITNIFQLN